MTPGRIERLVTRAVHIVVEVQPHTWARFFRRANRIADAEKRQSQAREQIDSCEKRMEGQRQSASQLRHAGIDPGDEAGSRLLELSRMQKDLKRGLAGLYAQGVTAIEAGTALPQQVADAIGRNIDGLGRAEAILFTRAAFNSGLVEYSVSSLGATPIAAETFERVRTRADTSRLNLMAAREGMAPRMPLL